MARQLCFAITLIGSVLLLHSPANAVTDAACEEQAANCVGRCANPGGAVNDNRCMNRCSRQVNVCLFRAHGAARHW
jgi:hypothetical protein